MRVFSRGLPGALLLLAAASAGALPPPPGLTVDRIVLLMRHGVRPPTKDPAMPAGTAATAWPAWQTRPGWLTARGARAVGHLGAYDRTSIGIGPACPAPGTVRIVADSDQRTIATAEAWARSFAPGCPIAIEHKPQDEPDPLFSPFDTGAATLDPAAADAAVVSAAGPGGIAAVEAGVRPLLARLDAILCAGAPSCGVAAQPTSLTPASRTRKPKLTGALDRASTAAQILLLEYADGKPIAEVGWGRAGAADVAALSRFHAIEFALLARPRYLAARNLVGLAPLIRDALADARPDAPGITLIAGHDTDVASLGGLLDVHWRVPGLAADDPAPGGALILERLTDRRGHAFVRAIYRSQTIAQIRALMPLGGGARPYAAVIPIPGCTARGIAGLCTLAEATDRLAPAPR